MKLINEETYLFVDNGNLLVEFIPSDEHDAT